MRDGCKVAQRLGFFNIDKNIITLAYIAFVRSVIQYCRPIYLHFTPKKLSKLFNKYPSKTSIPLKTSLPNTCERFVKKVNESPNHPLKCFLSILPSGRRFSIPFCRHLASKNQFFSTWYWSGIALSDCMHDFFVSFLLSVHQNSPFHYVCQ